MLFISLSKLGLSLIQVNFFCDHNTEGKSAVMKTTILKKLMCIMKVSNFNLQEVESLLQYHEMK